MGLHARISADSAPRAPAAAAPNARGEVRRAETQWLPLASLPALTAAWQDLADRALEPNVFYEAAFALPAAEIFGREAGAVVVRAAQAERLIGLFPARIERRRYAFGPQVLAGWTHPYAPLGTPLVDRDESAAAIGAWLDFIRTEPAMPRLALLPYLPSAGPFAAALETALSARNGRCGWFGRHARALLAPDGARAAYLEHAVSAKKRKELRRQRRLLDARGEISLSVATTPPDLDTALAAFLALEERGWKGAAGTAAAKDPALCAFMRHAVAALGARSQARIASLTLDDKLLAAAIVLQSGGAGWFWKTAYDEGAARASPGVQLAFELTRSLLADETLIRVDSCATPDHPMIDHLWRERLAMADCLIAPGEETAGALAPTLEHARRGAIAGAKWLHSRLRSR